MSIDNERETDFSRDGDKGKRRQNNDAGDGRMAQRAFRSRGSRKPNDTREPDTDSETPRQPEPFRPPDSRMSEPPRRSSEYPPRQERRSDGRVFNEERRSFGGRSDRDRPQSRGGGAGGGRSSGGTRPQSGVFGGEGRTPFERDSSRAYLTPHQERERRRREKMLAGEEFDEDEEDQFNVIKGGRQAIRKKKRRKVRVFFHRRLTRILLPKLLTKARYLSPFLAKQFVESGRVKVNARAVTSGLYEVNLRKERVTIDDVATEWPRRFWYMVYHKPRNVSCERGDPIFDELFEPTSTWYFPFGRIGRAHSGIIIVSNDPRMRKNQHFVDDELQKEYRIRINRYLTADELSELRNGVRVGDDYLIPIRVVASGESTRTMTLDITVLDDPFTRIFGALKAIGVEPLSMRRIRIGFLNEAMIPHAEWRELSGYEIQGLQLGRFTPGELPPEPDPEPRLRFQRSAGGRGRGDRGDRGRPRPGGDRRGRDDGRDGRRDDGRGRDDRNDRSQPGRERGDRRDFGGRDRGRQDRGVRGENFQRGGERGRGTIGRDGGQERREHRGRSDERGGSPRPGADRGQRGEKGRPPRAHGRDFKKRDDRRGGDGGRNPRN